ncbi:MAG TPA: hypothetical protein VFB13_18895 [Reyranella sp.]|jgi:hypothetical protein|nr:hypothetical protein [Reyranella sp.]
MLKRLLFAGLAAATIALPAVAQTMPFACPAAGTAITFDSGITVVSRGQDDMDCRMDTIGGKPFKIRALLFANPSADGGDMTPFISALRPERLWPLEVGKKIEASYSAGGKSWSYILTVAKYEKRIGPGDALVDSFVVEMNEQGPDGFRSLSRWWIAPGEHYMIRFDATNSAGKANRAVVTEIKRP